MKRWVRNLLVYLLLLLWISWPILSVLLSMWLADICGSTVDEGSEHPCFLWGHDIGGVVYTLFVLGWLMFITFPSGALLFVGYTIFAFVEWHLSKRKQLLPPPPIS